VRIEFMSYPRFEISRVRSSLMQGGLSDQESSTSFLPFFFFVFFLCSLALKIPLVPFSLHGSPRPSKDGNMSSYTRDKSEVQAFFLRKTKLR